MRFTPTRGLSCPSQEPYPAPIQRLSTPKSHPRRASFAGDTPYQQQHRSGACNRARSNNLRSQGGWPAAPLRGGLPGGSPGRNRPRNQLRESSPSPRTRRSHLLPAAGRPDRPIDRPATQDGGQPGARSPGRRACSGAGGPGSTARLPSPFPFSPPPRACAPPPGPVRGPAGTPVPPAARRSGFSALTPAAPLAGLRRWEKPSPEGGRGPVGVERSGAAASSVTARLTWNLGRGGEGTRKGPGREIPAWPAARGKETPDYRA